jgi:phenylacetate-CoA ligase
LAHLEELNRTQWLDREELLALQRQKLRRVVEYAYRYVPYYQRVFEQVGFQPDELQHDQTAFQKLPILTKAIIRENFDDLLTTEPSRRQQLSRVTTSGSTGHPLVFMQDHIVSM